MLFIADLTIQPITTGNYLALFSADLLEVLTAYLDQRAPNHFQERQIRKSEFSRNLNSLKDNYLIGKIRLKKDCSEEETITLEHQLQEKTEKWFSGGQPEINGVLGSNPITFSYSFHREQFFAQQEAQTAAIDYFKLWYGEHTPSKVIFQSEPEYTVEQCPALVSEEAILTSEEAKETIKEMQYAALLGSGTNISFGERRRLSLWILFHKAEFGLEEAKALTQNVNYGSLH